MRGQDPALKEAIRLMGIRQTADGQLFEKASAMMAAARAAAAPQTVFRLFDLCRQDVAYCFAGTELVLSGGTADKMLADCQKAAIMLCTLGLPFENAYRQWEKRDMAAAFMFDACGSALVEELCDQAEQEISALEPAFYRTDRFSPGYGDLSLAVQGKIFALLDAERRTGVHLNEAYLMTPQKSVTAIVGLSERRQRARIRGCAYCAMNAVCELRKGGKTCVSTTE